MPILFFICNVHIFVVKNSKYPEILEKMMNISPHSEYINININSLKLKCTVLV